MDLLLNLFVKKIISRGFRFKHKYFKILLNHKAYVFFKSYSIAPFPRTFKIRVIA